MGTRRKAFYTPLFDLALSVLQFLKSNSRLLKLLSASTSSIFSSTSSTGRLYGLPPGLFAVSFTPRVRFLGYEGPVRASGAIDWNGAKEISAVTCS